MQQEDIPLFDQGRREALESLREWIRLGHEIIDDVPAHYPASAAACEIANEIDRRLAEQGGKEQDDE